VTDRERREAIGRAQKERFKLFDFFANFKYFEEEYELLGSPRTAAHR